MARVNYRILPYADGWGVFHATEMNGPYLSVELACRVAVAMVRLGLRRGEQARLLFDNGVGEVAVLWPKEHPLANVHMLVANPWGGLSAVACAKTGAAL